MNSSRIIAEIDAQIVQLQQARALLAGVDPSATAAAPAKRKRGRPKGSGKKATALPSAAELAPKKRKLSAAGRKAIADAMKRRWAERKKAQTK